jgi:hypothetical protein
MTNMVRPRPWKAKRNSNKTIEQDTLCSVEFQANHSDPQRKFRRINAGQGTDRDRSVNK